MLISQRCKFITIDIPKTGTRSLRETLLPLNVLDIIGQPAGNSFYQHGTALDCQKEFIDIGLNFSDYFSFCIVRNPWERYLSFFKYYKEKAEEYLRAKDFEEWEDSKIEQGKIAANLFKRNEYYHILKTIIINQPEQSHYFLNENQDIMVSHIARFENIQKEFDYFCNFVGLDKVQLLHKNNSASQISCSDIYDQELIDLVSEKEKDVIELKGYKYQT